TYNDIYHLDLNSLSDTLFLRDYIESNPVMFSALITNDYKFWNNNPNQFIYVGMIGGQDPVPFINRYDQEYNLLNYFCCEVKKIDISTNDDSLIFSGGQLFGENQQANSIRSLDGGFNWMPVNDTLMFLSLNLFNNNILFLENYYGFLYRSTDAGNTLNLVDLLNQPAHSTSFLYDPDQLHNYRLFGNQTLRVSPNNGEPFSWQTKYSSDSEIYISIDESTSGTIYLADKKNILVSTDYGDNFTLYKSLERKIVGIYKKPNSNKLYAATKYKIYEITPDTIQIIKGLLVPSEVLDLYPLAIGNKWVYDVWGWWADTTYHSYSGITYREVIGDTVLANGQFYYKIFDPTTFNFPPFLFERIDTSSGKVYRYDNSLGLPNDEYLIDDLLAEVADTIWSSRHQYQDYFPFICTGMGTFDKWGIQGPRKLFTIFDLTGYTYSLSQGVGIDSIYDTFDFGENFVTLKGCIIDGIVYGDTTTVGVEDEETPIAANFKLEQNYPNPFNPKTNIQYAISNRQFVTLKVYDVLGNEIASLVNEEKPAGEYEVEFDATGLPSGIYFYQLKAGNFVETKKMLLIK
ncbi:MAG: T9SS type A sorting domain-containing protein, partial [Ignavibacteriaceae bacterium]